MEFMLPLSVSAEIWWSFVTLTTSHPSCSLFGTFSKPAALKDNVWDLILCLYFCRLLFFFCLCLSLSYFHLLSFFSRL